MLMRLISTDNDSARVFSGMQTFPGAMPGLQALRVLRLVRMFSLIRVFRQSFHLIVDTFTDSFTTLNTIVFLIFLSGMVMSALMFTVEATELDPLTHVRFC